MSGLKGRKALVTGGSRGIGAAIAQRLAKDGAEVAITYSASQDRAAAVVAEIERAGGKAIAIQADAKVPDAVRGAVDKAAQALGGLDILVNNAGVLRAGALPDVTEDDLDETLAVNVKAVFVATQAALPHLGEGARIINLGSVLGQRVPLPGLGTYSMSKFAVAGFTKAWARDLAQSGITVNAIQPGPIDTDMNPADSEFAEVLAPLTALGRYGKTEDIANAAAYLASAEAGYITGATINVDGGGEA